jgi:dihydrofolate reductase
MKVSIIVAVAENNIIGKRNSLPWYLPADLKHFKEITLGHHILMGQNTYASIGKPLPGRTTIILSNKTDYKQVGCVVVNTPDEAIKTAEKSGEKELMICGGGQVYKAFLPFADKIYLTKVHHKFDGDIYFPEINMKKWKVVSRESHEPDQKNTFAYDFLILEK